MKEPLQYNSDLEQRLQQHYQQTYDVPPDVTQLWTRLSPRLQRQPWWSRLFSVRVRQQTAPLHIPLFSGSRRLALGLILLVCLLVFTGAVYAVVPSIFDRLLHIDSQDKSVAYLAQTLQYTNVNQSQSVDGYTFTLLQAYADANRAIIACAINAPAGKNVYSKFERECGQLETDRGVQLPPMNGIGHSEQGNGAELNSFDAEDIQGSPGNLHLSLIVSYGHQNRNNIFTSEGNLKFNFTIPFHPGRVVSVHQALTADGKTITLDHLVITPSEVRAYMKNNSPDLLNKWGMFMEANLSVGKQVYHASDLLYDGVQTGSPYYGTDAFMVDFVQPLFDRHGKWTLTLQYNPVFIKHISQLPPGGPWVFHVNVP